MEKAEIRLVALVAGGGSGGGRGGSGGSSGGGDGGDGGAAVLLGGIRGGMVTPRRARAGVTAATSAPTVTVFAASRAAISRRNMTSSFFNAADAATAAGGAEPKRLCDGCSGRCSGPRRRIFFCQWGW